MRFFSKLTFVCNLCFIIAVILRWVENSNKKKGAFDGAIQLQPLESTLVVLGYGAILVNFLFLLCFLFLVAFKIKQAVPRWLIWANFLFFIAQFIYFFLLY